MIARCLLGGVGLTLVSCDRLQVSPDQAEEMVGTAHLSTGDYESFITTEGKVVAVMFHADWCGPCKKMGPTVESVVEEFEGKVVFGKIDVDDDGELAKSLGVNGIPDVRIYRGGIMVDAMKGAIPKEQVRNHFAIQVDQLQPVANDVNSAVEPPIKPMTDDWRPPGVERR